MTRTRYYVGLTTRDGMPVRDPQRDKVIQAVADAYGGGCTVYQATGWWRGDKEQSITIEVMDTGELLVTPDARSLAQLLGILANQESVLWTQDEITGGFVHAL